MALELCKDCGRMHYSTTPCMQVVAKAVAILDVQPIPRSAKVMPDTLTSETIKALAPVNAPPKPKRNRNAYMANYMKAVYRPRLKANTVNGPVNAVANTDA